MIVQSNILSKQECDSILELTNNHEFKKSKASYSNGEASKNFRTSLDIEIPTPKIVEDILKPKLIEYGIDSLPSTIVILKYTKGKEFKRHTDTGELFPHRLKTLSIQLSDKDEYTGGDFLIFKSKGEEVLFEKTLGNMVLFDSDREHLVTPILSGTRYAMVMWFTDSNFIKQKSII